MTTLGNGHLIRATRVGHAAQVPCLHAALACPTDAVPLEHVHGAQLERFARRTGDQVAAEPMPADDQRGGYVLPVVLGDEQPGGIAEGLPQRAVVVRAVVRERLAFLGGQQHAFE